MIQCSNCGRMLEDGCRFCPYCGSPVLIHNNMKPAANKKTTSKILIALITTFLLVISFIFGVIPAITVQVITQLNPKISQRMNHRIATRNSCLLPKSPAAIRRKNILLPKSPIAVRMKEILKLLPPL